MRRLSVSNTFNTSAFLNKPLQQDNVYPLNKVVDFAELTGMPARKGYDKAIISNGKIVNVVANSYGHLPNESFFFEVESKLDECGVQYLTRSINKDDRNFAVDYILTGDNFVTKVKNSKDEIVPLLRFTNSYDSKEKTTGHFGFFRKVCNNGLHVAQTEIGFKLRHSGNIENIVLPEIDTLITKFFDNEFYTLSKKFEVLAERALSFSELQNFVKTICNETGFFKFEKSDKNPEPSLNAETVINTIYQETKTLGLEQPSLWLGYNSFNEILYSKFEKTFDAARTIDNKLFNAVLAYN